MGIVLQFAHHARASSRAAKAVSFSAVTPLSFAIPVASIAAQRSAGITSRCHHFETADAPAPISDAKASREGHSSITARKDVRSLIPTVLGQSVLNCKANLSLDGTLSLGQNVRMSETDVEAKYKQEFTARVKAARIATGTMKQWQVAEALGVPQDHYKHWEKGRLMPHHLIGRFCIVTRVDPVWLMTGHGAKPIKPLQLAVSEEAPARAPKRQKRTGSKRAA